MKTRKLLISNSSSSSFIVSFKKVPDNIYDLHEMLFGTDQNKTIDYYGTEAKSMDIAFCVMEDIRRNLNISKKNIIKTKKQFYEILSRASCLFGYRNEDIYKWFDFSKEISGSRKIEQKYRKQTGLDIRDKNADQKVYQKWSNLFHQECEDMRKKKEKKLKDLVNELWPHLHLPDHTLMSFHYSDNDGPMGSILEHGNIFKRLKHLQGSEH